MLALLACSQCCGFAQTLQINRVPADIVSFQGEIGLPYSIETSTNMSDWSQLVLLNGSVSGFHSYTNFPVQNQLLYRTVSEQPTNGGPVSVTLSPMSPLAPMIQIDDSVETLGVALAAFDARSSSVPGTLNKLAVSINTTGVTNATQLISRVKLQISSTLVSESIVGTNGIVVFDNLGISLPSDTVVTLKLLVDVVRNIGGVLNGSTAQATILAQGTFGGISNNPVVVDQNFSILGVNTSTSLGNVLTFTDTPLILYNVQVISGNRITNQNGSVSCYVSFIFTLSAGNNSVFVSKEATNMLSTVLTGSGSWSYFNVIPGNGNNAGDGIGWYYIAAGQTRTFTVDAVTSDLIGSGSWSVVIDKIRYGATPSTTTTHSITSGLGSLTASGYY